MVITNTFKTNINCSGCVARVKIELEKLTELSHWSVNTMVPDKFLSVTAPEARMEEVISAVKRAGFNIEKIK
ncbi:MAG: hypothetical protein K1X40_03685 [Chitinophagales bacterium]|nr:hypothetical protein [Chitinophagales bacterium]